MSHSKTDKRSFATLLIIVGMGLVGLGVCGRMESAWAQIPENVIPSLEERITVNFEPRPGKGEPDRTTGAGSRGGCENDPDNPNQRGLTLLSPGSSRLTAEDHPTFFVYVPKTSATSIQFSLFDRENREIYYVDQEIENTPGIMAFKLPDEQPALKNGESYYLYFAISCSVTEPSANPYIWGQVQRTQPTASVAAALANEPSLSLNRVALYGKDGLWYDALSTLAALQEEQPNNLLLHEIWEDLLKSVGLGAVAEEPLLSHLLQ